MVNQDLHNIRREYTAKPLHKLEMAANPFVQFEFWMAEAMESNILDPTAATLSTVDSQGQPSSRIILVKEFSQKGLVIYTNYHSKKGQDLQENNKVALLFYWDSLHRQIRLQGTVEKVSEEHSDQYFSKRPIDSQIAAASSDQSQPITSRQELETKYKQLTESPDPVIRPRNWGGYLIKPDYFEFWQGRPSRLHDRMVYQQENGKWALSRIQP